MKTVASISFRDNKSVSMDVEGVSAIEMGAPMEVETGVWFCEMLIRTAHGTVALQLTADDPEKFKVQDQGQG
jgi:hypothetical protein